jgi:RNA-directed DNA polymerase
MQAMMTKLKLTVNDTKTRVAKLPEEKFDFPGYSVLQKNTGMEVMMT